MKLSILITLLFALGCASEDAVDGDDAVQAVRYLDQVGDIVQSMRSLEVDIRRAVPADSIDIEVIYPLVEQRFRPKVAELAEQADALQPTLADLQPTHQLLQDYLRLRLEAFDIILEGVRQQDAALFEQFPQRLDEANTVGQSLERSIERLRQSLGRAYR